MLFFTVYLFTKLKVGISYPVYSQENDKMLNDFQPQNCYLMPNPSSSFSIRRL